MLFDAIRQEIFDQIKAALGQSDFSLEIPPDLRMGDFAFPAFRLAKVLRKAPPAISQELAATLQKNTKLNAWCEITNLGPYVNFTVKREILVGQVLESLLLSKNNLAEIKPASPPTAVLEFSSPNVAKAFNIYHLRSTMIGNCLFRVFKTRGWNPVAINHLGDWGTQYGTLAIAYEKWGDDRELEKRGIEYLVELYVRINKEIESTPALADQAREAFAKLERGDEKIREVWEKFVALSLKEFQHTYQRLNVSFDHYWGESFYIDKVPALEERLKKSGLLVESEGAQVVNLDTYGMPPCIVRKADGSTIYATRDLAAAIYRYEKLQFKKMVYVVGGEQKLHFAQVFKVLELLNLPWAKDCVHIDFGLYRFKDAKMSTRKGNYVTMESVLDQAVERVRQIMDEKAIQTTAAGVKTLSEEERHRNAEIIGVGAIVFNDLSTDRNTDVNFDLERVLDFEGETGPYILYAHTRCLGILRNAPAELISKIDIAKLLDLGSAQPGFEHLWQAAQTKLEKREELDLVRLLARLPLVLDQVLESYKPSILATYLIDITKGFNAFYRAHKVLVDDVELARARLALVLATQRTLLKGLTLLGMRVPERM